MRSTGFYSRILGTLGGRCALGGLDVLVNSAGIGKDELIEDFDEAAWDKILDVNLKDTFFCIRPTLARASVLSRRPGGLSPCHAGNLPGADNCPMMLHSTNVAVPVGGVTREAVARTVR